MMGECEASAAVQPPIVQNNNAVWFSLQALASAIASTEVLTAQQVVKGENGQEVSYLLNTSTPGAF